MDVALHESAADGDYARVARAIRYLNDHQSSQPRLAEVARAVGLSPFHFQRLFRRWAGVSPKQYLQFLTVEHAKQRLQDCHSVLDASLEAGLSGPGRLHDHFVTVEAVTPGEYRSRGAGLTVRWGMTDSSYGPTVIARTRRGVCGLFFPDGDPEAAEDALRGSWPRATLCRDDAAARRMADAINRAFQGGERVPLHLNGTNFQLQVWRALLRIPAGAVTTYAGIARRLGRASASRAVGQAVGHNPVAWLIPCHRVIRATGALGGYRWGDVRKQAMLALETADVATRPRCPLG